MDKKQLLKNIKEKLEFIYGDKYEENFTSNIEKLINKWEKKSFDNTSKVSEKNIYLITYGDSIYEDGKPSLETLKKFLNKEIGDTITDVHLLPMFTYTSDDGFSVVDYMEIDKELGNWNNIKTLSKDYRLMFDFVANHISKSSKWFKGYIDGDKKYEEFFTKEEDGFDSSKVVRPRTTPLFHKYEGKDGVKTAWSTFSEDQVDVNFKHFHAMLQMTEILLEYAQSGATSIRLDAIGFLWKESGTNCIHLPQTHAIIKIWRLILDYFKPNTQVITETNVPHKENISYLGNGSNEAHMVYQFTLPPLVLYTMTAHNTSKLTNWAKSINKVSENATYFNFLSSHDGIGMRPTEGVLNDEERQIIVDKTISNGGRVSYKNNVDGTKSVYELNINYNDALINIGEDRKQETQINKILAAHAILLSFVGVPAIYYHSLLGSRNYQEGTEKSGINRRINREKLEFNRICNELKDDKRREAIFNGLKNLIDIRKQEEAFSPYASQRSIELGDKIFALERINEATGEKIIFILNVDSKKIELETNIIGLDIIKNRNIENNIMLNEYEFMWIKC